ncbi:MAG: sugar phosphate isomerase/epimerase, partial [Ruminiclostridium sp.]|nr:sugar phosphate isomerase/epimerase [Ruminiclostridium sp.]
FIVKDNDLVSVEAGGGEMDYRRIMEFVKKEKPFIHVTLENTSPENAEASRKLIQSVWDSV